MAAVKMAVSSLPLFFLSLLFASVSAQLASTGVCETVLSKASCEDATTGCPPGKTLLKSVPKFAPWLCGGWQKICCVEDVNAPPIDDPRCGTGDPTGRILNGRNTSACDWPYLVSIRGRVQPNVLLNQATTQHSCAGVIIDKYWVLTHAICLYSTNKQIFEAANEFLVVAGEYNTDQIDRDPRYVDYRQLEQFIQVRQAFVYPGFANIRYLSDLNLSDNQQTNGNALALIKLAQPINNHCASVACLPSSSALTSPSCDTFKQCVILGWGFDTANFQNTDGSLKQGFVSIYKDYVCDFLQTSAFASGPARFNGSACQSSQFGQDACLGDQGGPVLCYDGSRWTAQGIIPFRLCADNMVSPYVIDVKLFENWIYDTIKNNP